MTSTGAQRRGQPSEVGVVPVFALRGELRPANGTAALRARAWTPSGSATCVSSPIRHLSTSTTRQFRETPRCASGCTHGSGNSCSGSRCRDDRTGSPRHGSGCGPPCYQGSKRRARRRRRCSTRWCAPISTASWRRPPPPMTAAYRGSSSPDARIVRKKGKCPLRAAYRPIVRAAPWLGRDQQRTKGCPDATPSTTEPTHRSSRRRCRGSRAGAPSAIVRSRSPLSRSDRGCRPG